jgi:WhiB family transcriptional regulator, redox-sensing transcriptional regulator
VTTATATKHCSKCQTTKNTDDFNTDNGRTDGLTAWCRTCNADHCRARRAKEIPTKTCVLCEVEQPKDDFPRDWDAPDRRSDWCLACTVEAEIEAEEWAACTYFAAAPESGLRPAAEPERLHNDWRHKAACRHEDPELFFPVGNTGPALLQIEEAKAVCRRCPEMERCLQDALETNQDFGVFGGMSEDERKALKRRAARNRARASA